MFVHAIVDPPPSGRDRELPARLLQTLEDGLGVVDRDGIVRWANASLASLAGEPVDALVDTSWRRRLAEGEQAAWDTAFAAAGRGESASCSVVLHTAGGPARALDLALRPMRSSGGDIEGVALSACDPVHRQGNDEMLRWIARATAPLTGDDFFHTLTRHFAAAFGLRRALIAECIDRPVTRVRTLAYWFDAQMRPNYEFELAGTPCERTVRDGRVYCVSQGLGDMYPRARAARLDGYLGAPIFDSEGSNVIGHIAFETEGALDAAITGTPLFQIFASRACAELRRKRAEDVLRASEEHYRLLVEHQTDVVVKRDARQRVVFASPSFHRLFGVEERAVLGTAFRAPVAPEDASRFDEAWAALAHPPHESRFEERLRTVEGWRCIAWSQKALLDAQGTVTAVVAAGRDVTERLRAEEQARSHLQQLAHVGRVSAMGEMASAIAHELNQPLTAVRTYAQACRRLLAAGEDARELGATLERVASQAERAAQIVQRLRGFLAQQEVQAMPVDPNVLVREVVELCRPEAAQGGVQLRLALAPDGSARLNVDPIQVEQVVLNLVRNGMESIQQAERDARVVTVSTWCEGGEARIAVEDTGAGVTPDAAQRVFDAFFTTKPGGMGIGLALSRSIAQAHGGRLWLDDAARDGARFLLALPLATAPGDEA